ncbi:sigma-54-dependent transcriptional regulator [Pseudodesulfovibrio tunisiensis]|uniref:sigma-54-dependent transcriptional regulator n=1 Tax=Pseudodesulfovibrio tunisiensis TaxID=463192 RepID=UPI001FB23280|nr:sigma-54 dependent transcriptional regulator [Pseudodesulfovibrio tunisiensis]
MPQKILVVDDEQDMLAILKRSLSRQGHTVHTASSGDEAWKAISETMYDLVISDLAMQPMGGLELLKQIRTIDSILPVIIMTGVGSIQTAVEAIKLGAYHYITKPFKTQELILLANRAIEHGQLHRKLETFNSLEERKDSEFMVVGHNSVIQQMMNTIDKVSASDAPILIQGETGTGKSLFAKGIHKASDRKDRPFYTIDCGALAEHLLESELFGHVKGAFTGAICAKRGLLEEAQGGTIFLDEIGELTPSTQVKLLRAIQEKEIKPVGGNKPISIDVRFLSATSRNLDEGVESGEFRKDLYYRLAVIPLQLPPLRERQEDIMLFVDHFIRKFNTRYNKKVTEVSPGAVQMLMDSPWKGNIRELENVIERAVLLTDDQTITLDSLCSHARAFSDPDTAANQTMPLKKAVERAEAQAIRSALAAADGNRSKAAQILGIGRRTLYDKIDAYNI